jgi:hypothetical protein
LEHLPLEIFAIGDNESHFGDGVKRVKSIHFEYRNIAFGGGEGGREDGVSPPRLSFRRLVGSGFEQSHFCGQSLRYDVVVEIPLNRRGT